MDADERLIKSQPRSNTDNTDKHKKLFLWDAPTFLISTHDLFLSAFIGVNPWLCTILFICVHLRLQSFRFNQKAA
jgi:hypothetical protein